MMLGNALNAASHGHAVALKLPLASSIRDVPAPPGVLRVRASRDLDVPWVGNSSQNILFKRAQPQARTFSTVSLGAFSDVLQAPAPCRFTQICNAPVWAAVYEPALYT